MVRVYFLLVSPGFHFINYKVSDEFLVKQIPFDLCISEIVLSLWMSAYVIDRLLFQLRNRQGIDSLLISWLPAKDNKHLL